MQDLKELKEQMNHLPATSSQNVCSYIYSLQYYVIRQQSS
jgi:hypothetical protein